MVNIKKIFLFFSLFLFFFNFISTAEISKELRDYTIEQANAYNRAFQKGITTMQNAKAARLGDGLTRGELAKMMSVYIEQMGKATNYVNRNVIYKDVDSSLGDLEYYIKKAYQYQIMGIDAYGNPLEYFNPYGKLTRAEFGTVLSRVLYGNMFNTPGANYYENHLKALNKAGYMNKIDNPFQIQSRGDAMIMMSRTDSSFTPLKSDDEKIMEQVNDILDDYYSTVEENNNSLYGKVQKFTVTNYSSSSPYVDEWLDISIRAISSDGYTATNYQNRVNIEIQEYLNGSWKGVGSSRYYLKNSSYDFLSSDKGEKTIYSLIKFYEPGEYRIKVIDYYDSSIYGTRTINVAAKTTNNYYTNNYNATELEVSCSNSYDRNEWIDVEIKAIAGNGSIADNYNKKVKIEVQQYRNGSWRSASSSDYELDRNYYSFSTSDYGKVQLYSLLKFKSEGEFRLKITENNDVSVYGTKDISISGVSKNANNDSSNNQDTTNKTDTTNDSNNIVDDSKNKQDEIIKNLEVYGIGQGSDVSKLNLRNGSTLDLDYISFINNGSDSINNVVVKLKLLGDMDPKYIQSIGIGGKNSSAGSSSNTTCSINKAVNFNGSFNDEISINVGTIKGNSDFQCKLQVTLDRTYDDYNLGLEIVNVTADNTNVKLENQGAPRTYIVQKYYTNSDNNSSSSSSNTNTEDSSTEDSSTEDSQENIYNGNLKASMLPYQGKYGNNNIDLRYTFSQGVIGILKFENNYDYNISNLKVKFRITGTVDPKFVTSLRICGNQTSVNNRLNDTDFEYTFSLGKVTECEIKAIFGSFDHSRRNEGFDSEEIGIEIIEISGGNLATYPMVTIDAVKSEFSNQNVLYKIYQFGS